MLKMSDNWLTDITAPSRIIDAKVEVYRASTLVYTFLPDDYLSFIKIERLAEDGKTMGYSICQKATVEILDAAAAPFQILKDDEIRIRIGTETELAKNPYFYVDEITRDEVKKKITIVAYDLINKTTKHTWSELNITYPCSIFDIVNDIGIFLGVTTSRMYVTTPMGIEYTTDTIPNLDGTEILRDIINKIAEAMGMVAYMDHSNNLRFRKITGTKSPITISKDDYFELKLGGSERITEIISVNELEDVSAFAGTKDGRTHIMRSNPFVENRDDTQAILQNILDTDKDDLFYSYSLKWRGNPSLEIGDRVGLEKEDGTTIDILYLGETLTYNGGLNAVSEWKLTEEDSVETPPQTIGDAIKKTYAKVDKVNKRIELVAADTDDRFSEMEITTENISASVQNNADSISNLALTAENISASVQNNADSISNLALTADDIKASVSSVEELIEDGLESVNGEITTLSQRVDLGVTAEDVSIAITKELENGVDKVTTSTGFTFNEEGLTVSKSNSDITTTITEDGMTVKRGGDTVLTANNEGVKAEDLHATTYLIIGTNSRFEDYGSRTGCFWIG